MMESTLRESVFKPGMRAEAMVVTPVAALATLMRGFIKGNISVPARLAALATTLLDWPVKAALAAAKVVCMLRASVLTVFRAVSSWRI